MAEITINGVSISAYNASLLSGSYASLLAPADVKEWVSNDNPSTNGVEYIPPTTTIVKERPVSLIFLIQCQTPSRFLFSYNQFISILQNGINDFYIPELERHYFLKYETCTEFDQFNLTTCKLAVKFTEPDPTKVK